MAWISSYSRSFYHGTTLAIANDIFGMKSPIDVKRGKLRTDFGRGFYMTTSLYQAKNWANYRIVPRGGTVPTNQAAVLEIMLTTEELSDLMHLAMVWSGADHRSMYWQFVSHCRKGGTHLHAKRKPDDYDVVCGPVSIWKQYQVIANADQFSFHSDSAEALLRTAVTNQRCRIAAQAYQHESKIRL